MSTRRPVVEMMDPMMVEIMRGKTPAERLAIAFRMWESARAMVLANVRNQNPNWSEGEIEREVAARMRGRIDW
ncbi:MAG: hypothetical protein V3R99_10210 [Thermoguttaceae bacterium]